VAVKVVERALLASNQKLTQEIAILQMLDHPYIIKLHDAFFSTTKLFIIMELVQKACNGNEEGAPH
jgi:serine/threonine protein kinase